MLYYSTFNINIAMLISIRINYINIFDYCIVYYFRYTTLNIPYKALSKHTYRKVRLYLTTKIT